MAFTDTVCAVIYVGPTGDALMLAVGTVVSGILTVSASADEVPIFPATS